jgi:hypothetical protein
MLIRAQDGTIYHRDHITQIALAAVKQRDPDGAGTRFTGPVTGYCVEATIAGKNVRLTDTVADEAEVIGVLDRIMQHRDGNLDLTRPWAKPAGATVPPSASSPSK